MVLHLIWLWVGHPGEIRFPKNSKITAVKNRKPSSSKYTDQWCLKQSCHNTITEWLHYHITKLIKNLQILEDSSQLYHLCFSFFWVYMKSGRYIPAQQNGLMQVKTILCLYHFYNYLNQGSRWQNRFAQKVECRYCLSHFNSTYKPRCYYRSFMPL